jgi:hypothetical protein
MNRSALISSVGRRSYRLLLVLLLLALFLSLAVCIRMGSEAALGCLVWSIAAVLLISLLVSAIGSIIEEICHIEAREGNGGARIERES